MTLRNDPTYTPRPGATSLWNWPLLVSTALAGFVIALFGTYWDDAWHTETGRDSFFIAPHITLYAGISLTGGALFLWTVLAARRVGLRQALRSPALALALLGIAITFVAAPADNAWHVAFGRDAVLWSPPHMLGVAGSLAIAAGLLLELAPGAGSRHRHAPAFVAAAAVVAVCTIPVLEYETDVPQFDPGFYLPALATGAAFAFGLIRLALAEKNSATKAALVQTALVSSIAAILLVVGMPTPLIPLLFVPAWAFDRFGARYSVLGRAIVLCVGIYLLYIPYLDWATSGLYVTTAQIAWGLPLAVIGAAAAFLITAERGPRVRARAGVIASVLLLALPALALAHDPGQGQELTTADLAIRAPSRAATIEILLTDTPVCRELEPVATMARRSGETVAGRLIRTGPCSFEGQVALSDRGRWFVYADFSYRGRDVETWMAVHTESADVLTGGDRSVYFPPTADDPGVKKVAGIGIYTVLIATMIAIPALYRRRRPHHS